MSSERQQKHLVTRGHIDAAAAAIDRDGVPARFHRTTPWMVEVAGSLYPIRAIVALACASVGLHTVASSPLDGTEYHEWRRHLRRLGYRLNRLESAERYEGENDLHIDWSFALQEQAQRAGQGGSEAAGLEVFIGGGFHPAAAVLGLPPSSSAATVLGAARDAGLAVRVAPDPVDAELAALADSESLATETKREITARIGQGRFREALLQVHGRCVLTGIATPAVLRAAHIHRWADCADTPTARHDIDNGLLLAANLDCLFETGLIAFDDEGQILISPELDEAARDALGLRPDLRLAVVPSAGQRGYLAKHRERTRAMREASA